MVLDSLTHAPALQILAGFCGLLTGSVVVYAAPRLAAHRVPLDESAPRPRALAPLAGLVWVRRNRIQATLVELLVPAIFIALSIHYGATVKLTLSCAYCLLLVTIAYIDLQHRLVLNRLSFPGIALALLASLLWPDFGIFNALLGAVTGLAIFGVLELIGRGALGTGDTKLAALIGAMRGLPGVLNALLLGVVIGGIAAAFFLLVLRRGRRQYMAYAPYLAAGAVLSFFVVGP